MIEVTISKDKKKLTIVMDVETPRPSGSGKTLVIASSHGNMTSTAMLDGKFIKVGVNAYVSKD